MIISRDKVEKELRKACEQRGVGSIEQQQLLLAMSLQIQLDIRDLLVEIRDQNKETVIDFVPPDYGKEDRL